MAFLYDLARSKPYYWVTNFLPVLEKALGRILVLPSRKTKYLEDMLKNFPGDERDVYRLNGKTYK